MKSNVLYLFLLTISIVSFSSCGSSRRGSNLTSVRDISNCIGIPLTPKDNIKLYGECASWLGTPYRHGETTKRGVDCSGLAGHIYKEVYHKNLSRSTADILKKNCSKIRKGSLKEGDLVFFNTDGKNKKTPTHVGIYLKDGKFIHASTSKGVMVNNLNEPYYARNWLTGGECEIKARSPTRSPQGEGI